MTRAVDFSADPAALPETVLHQTAAEMLDWHGSDMSVMEMSHRGKEFIAIHAKAEEDSGFKRPFSFPMAPRTRQSTALGALESVFGGSCSLLSVDAAAENRPSQPPFAGYPRSPGHFHRSRKPSGAADSSGSGFWVA